MVRFGTSWGKTREVEEDGWVWLEWWYIDITFSKFPLDHTRCCIAKYDGVPYFLFILLFIMFRFGKAGCWE